MSESGPPPPARFRPHATRELGGMFDDVSGRYDLLNQIMSLGQDRVWRAAMWRAVPESAHAVLDLCTGSGASLPGLRRAGRLVLGADVSLRMLERAAERQRPGGWAPRLFCADAFELPLPDASLDAVTIAFGIRNLRPHDEALAELARVLRAGGTLVVLEAAAPAAGPLAPFHRFYLRHVVPLVGRLSSDPSAYAYLSRSIFEFGDGAAFERAIAAAGFNVGASHGFMAGATRLWSAHRLPETGQKAALPDGRPLQFARPEAELGGKTPTAAHGGLSEWRVWTGVQLALSLAITGTLAFGLDGYAKYGGNLLLAGWQRSLAWFLLLVGMLGFGVRSVLLLLRIRGPGRRP